MSKEKEFHDLMENMNVYNRIMQSYFTTQRYYGIEELLLQSEAHVIESIGDHSGLSLMELGELTVRTKSSMSMMITKLAKKGLVTRTRTDEDSRRYSITLTEKGKIVYDYHEKLDAKNYKRLLGKLVTNNQIEEIDLIKANKVARGLIEAILDDIENNK